MKNVRSLLLINLVLGFIWAKSNIDKFTSDKFVKTLGATLTKAADKNPNLWYKSFLQSIAIPNSVIFAEMVRFGELFTAVVIIITSLYLLFNRGNHLVYLILILSLIGGFFLNLNFWLAFAHTSPAADSLNLLMGAVELIGAVTIYQAKGKPAA